MSRPAEVDWLAGLLEGESVSVMVSRGSCRSRGRKTKRWLVGRRRDGGEIQISGERAAAPHEEEGED